jgi:hypothetical protein
VKGGWLVGVVAVVVLGYITYNSLRTEGVGVQGLERGAALPPFAMPLAASAKEGDANIATKPDSGPEGDRPACSVRGRDILNSCELSERGPVVLAFVVTRSGDCARQVDALDRVAARVRGVAFAAVAVREDRERLRELIRSRGWRVPVGYDHDGAVGNLYGLGAVCPLLTFAGADGRVAGTHLGALDDAALAAAARALLAGRPLPELGAAVRSSTTAAAQRSSAIAAAQRSSAVAAAQRSSAVAAALRSSAVAAALRSSAVAAAQRSSATAAARPA